MPALRSFASSDRFLSEIASPATLRPGYVLLGDEAFLYQRCRQGVLATLAPEGTRDFSLHDLDLADTSIFDVLDLAQTPSLMAPFQVIFVRNLKQLYGRGSKKEEFAAIDAYFRSPNPAGRPALRRRPPAPAHRPAQMDYQDKERYDRIRETLGDWCGSSNSPVSTRPTPSAGSSPPPKPAPSNSIPTPPASWSTLSAPT